MCFKTNPSWISKYEYLRHNIGFAGSSCFWKQGMSVCMSIFLFVFRKGSYQVWKGRFHVFCIKAPAQPSATVLLCIRPYCIFFLVIGIPQAPVLQTTNQQKALCRKLSVQRQHKSVLLFVGLFASNLFVSVCLYTLTWKTVSPSALSIFSRVHATLQPALSVRPLVRPSVTLYFFVL